MHAIIPIQGIPASVDFPILRTSANWRNRRILKAWEINTCRNSLNRDDRMHLPQP